MTVTVSVGSAVRPSGAVCWDSFGQTPVASVAEVESPDALRNRTFDPRSSLVQLLAFCTGLSPSGLLQRLILLPWLQLEPTGLPFGFGA